MLYLTSFKIVADFFINLDFQLLFPEKKNLFCSHLAETDKIVN